MQHVYTGFSWRNNLKCSIAFSVACVSNGHMDPCFESLSFLSLLGDGYSCSFAVTIEEGSIELTVFVVYQSQVVHYGNLQHLAQQTYLTHLQIFEHDNQMRHCLCTKLTPLLLLRQLSECSHFDSFDFCSIQIKLNWLITVLCETICQVPNMHNKIIQRLKFQKGTIAIYYREVFCIPAIRIKHVKKGRWMIFKYCYCVTTRGKNTRCCKFLECMC